MTTIPSGLLSRMRWRAASVSLLDNLNAVTRLRSYFKALYKSAQGAAKDVDRAFITKV